MLATYRFLLSRRWLGLLAAAIAAAALCAALGRWQLDRLHQRHARNAVIEHNLGAAPVPAADLLRPGHPLPPGQQWRRVTATGRYDTGHELVVRNRTLDGAVGYHVLTPLVTEQGPALLVDRGWVPTAETAATRPDVPPPPSGEATVTARMRQAEPPKHGPAPPAGQVTRIAVATIARSLPYPVYGGYGELVAQDPPSRPAPTALPPPEVSEGPHLAYAFQWFLFGLMALGGYVVLARREARDLAAGRPGRAGRPGHAGRANRTASAPRPVPTRADG